MVVFVVLGDFRAAGIRSFRPFPTCAGQIRAERGRVEIPFLIGQRVVLGKPAEVHVVADGLAGGDKSRDELVSPGIVVSGWLDGQAVVGGREAEAKAIGLYAWRWIAGCAVIARLDQRQKAAERIAGNDVWIKG